MAAVSSIALGVLAAASAAQAYSTIKQTEAQKSAQGKAEDAASKQEQAAQREFKRQNRKQPDIAAMLAANRDAAGGGVGSTMLTGASGVEPGSLSLGKSTLLGQ